MRKRERERTRKEEKHFKYEKQTNERNEELKANFKT